MTLARLYGRLLTQSSQSVVTEGFRSVLEKEGLLAGVFGVDVSNLEDDDSALDGANARHGIFTGPMEHLHQMFEQGRHEFYWIMLAPNSNLLPDRLVKQIQQIQGYERRFRGTQNQVRLIAPSRWAANVVAEQIPGAMVMSVPHGVSPEYTESPFIADTMRVMYREGEFRVLHFSTSAQARKGTFELIRDWMEIDQRPKGWFLACVLDYSAKIALHEKLLDEAVKIDASVSLCDRGDLLPAQCAWALSTAHVVCQPSRGEAFGLIPLQALCTGVPVVATMATGHSEYLTHATAGLEAVYVPYPANPQASYHMGPLDDLPGSIAPVLNTGEVGKALKSAHARFIELQAAARQAAPALRKEWSWQNQLQHFVNELRRL